MIQCIARLIFECLSGDKNKLLKVLFSCTFIPSLLILLICVATVQNQGKGTPKAVVYVSRDVEGRVFLGYNGRGLVGNFLL